MKIAIVGDILHSPRGPLQRAGCCAPSAPRSPWSAPPTLLPVGVDSWPCDDRLRPRRRPRRRRRRRDDAARPARADERGVLPHRARVLAPLRPRRRPAGRAMPEHAIVMHPGPMNRGLEISAGAADSPRSAVVEQVANGVAVRMAVLYLLLSGDQRAPRTRPKADHDHHRHHRRLPDRGACLLAETTADLLISGGRIAAVGPDAAADERAPPPPSIEANGLVALPGLVDLHTHLREPGREDAETVRNRHPRRRPRRLHRRARHGQHQPGRRHRRRRRAGLAARAGEPATATCARSAPSPSAWAGERLAELGAMADSAARRARLLRRRQVRVRPGDHAPRARVRQGVRRRHRPARAGAAPHRGRPDERGRRSPRCSAWPAGPPSPRSRSSPATCCSPQHVGSRLHVCHVSTAGRVEIIRWAKERGIQVTAEVTPHHLLLTDELVAQLRPGLQGQPAAAHARRT